jgi:hypothetical protein
MGSAASTKKKVEPEVDVFTDECMRQLCRDMIITMALEDKRKLLLLQQQQQRQQGEQGGEQGQKQVSRANSIENKQRQRGRSCSTDDGMADFSIPSNIAENAAVSATIPPKNIPSLRLNLGRHLVAQYKINNLKH